MQIINPEKWEKEFEEKYGSFELCDIVNQKDHDRIKSFIRSQIAEAEARGRSLAVDEIEKKCGTAKTTEGEIVKVVDDWILESSRLSNNKE